MEILPYEPALNAELTAAYNEAVRDVPHCYPVAEKDMASVTASPDGDGAKTAPLRERAIFVALEGKAMVGFVDAAIGRPGPLSDQDQGVLRFLRYAPGCRTAGQGLLDAAERHVRERGVTQIQAFPQEYRYPFYHLKAAYLSERMGHVEALLGLRRYRRARGEVFLDWLDFAPAKPRPEAPDAEVTVDFPQGRGARPGVKIQAFRGGEKIGACECVSCGEYATASEAQDWAFTTWLGVDEATQGKGLGRHLLQRALNEAHAIGYRHAVISTAWDNYRAYLFYANFGYQVADWTYGFLRVLE